MAAVDKEIDDLIGDGKQASNENWVQDEKPDHDGVFEEVDGNAEEEAQEKLRREREAMAQALTLEIVGDLPFAEVKPPENVLFVCKLNPVTEG
jgi:Mn-containing catalase